MSGDSLDDENIKLVSYTIVSIRPDEERVMPRGQGSIMVKERLSREDFVSWIVARYVKTNPVDDRDRKYLRVHFAVANRWPRPAFKYDEREIGHLREIAARLEISGGTDEPRPPKRGPKGDGR